MGDPLAVLWRFPVPENTGDLGLDFEELLAREQKRTGNRLELRRTRVLMLPP